MRLKPLSISMFVLVAAAVVSETAKAEEIVRTLSCKFTDVFSEFEVEADMTGNSSFVAKGNYISGENETFYPLSQKSPRQGELHRFVLAESDPDPDQRLRIQVFKDKDKKRDAYGATATFLGLDSPLKEVDGSCFYY